jgi:membrane-bound serine protease (ClpP class)
MHAVLRGFFTSLALFAALVFAQPLLAESVAAGPPRVLAVHLDNDINPVTAGYVDDQIERANDEGYSAVVLVLDTPGGLSESMRDIVKKELASRLPVVVYVSPDGARAASAGVWIGQAADILAMAPQTNIGSSTPISIGGEDIQKDLRRKVVNDAAAQLRALAKEHGRNFRWADAAVRRASNLTAREALGKNVIDVIAPTLPALLDKIDGQKTVPRGLVLDTADAEVTDVEMSLWKRILDTLIDPNIIALMLSLGVLGIIVELYNPGMIFPAAFGGICLIIGFYGLQVLPVNWAGVLLMLLAAGFWGAEPFVMSHGALALAGAACFVFGALLLFEPAGDTYQVSLPLAIAIAGSVTLFLAFAVAKVVQVRRQPVAVGASNLVGTAGVVRHGGLVAIKGELWQAQSADGEPLTTGETVVVEEVEDGLRLVVRHAGGTPETIGSPS